MIESAIQRQPMNDQFGRPLGSLRLSVTDRCNMRCRYCMPEENYVWLPRESILRFEELSRVAGIFASLGASRVRLTGGEPLLRHDLHRLIALLRNHRAITDLALTTNGLLLARHAAELHAAGLDRVTVSLDTLRPERMEEFARTSHHGDIIAGIEALKPVGFSGTKLNTVVIRGYNDDELAGMIEFGRTHDAEIRFIEYMDVGGATQWQMDQVVSAREMLEVLRRRYGPIEPWTTSSGAPAERFRLSDGTTFGIIASTTQPFCRTCDRSRITADGTWFLCLYSENGIDVREFLRNGASDEDIAAIIRSAWSARRDRGAEVRAQMPERGALYQLESLRSDPRREMHTRGG